MIDVKNFYEYLENKKINFFTGVPDSLLQEFCTLLEKKDNNVIAANEGNAIAIAAGYHLATNEIPFVYLQNSGLGNCINPLTSLTNKEVYSIPLILMIGWRGEPGINDEPQHLKPGASLIRQLELLDIPYFILDDSSDYKNVIESVLTKIAEINSPVAIIVKKNVFSIKTTLEKINQEYQLSRSEAIKIIINNIKTNDIVISTTGKASRELLYLRSTTSDQGKDFMTVGSMGHVASISSGLALGCKKRNVVCIDGDGSALMHMGSIAINGSLDLKNFIYIILNNGSHDSVGGQRTVGFEINFCKIAEACNFKNVKKCSSAEDLKTAISQASEIKMSSMIEVMINNKNDIAKLPRPKQLPIENKKLFKKFIFTE